MLTATPTTANLSLLSLELNMSKRNTSPNYLKTYLLNATLFHGWNFPLTEFDKRRSEISFKNSFVTKIYHVFCYIDKWNIESLIEPTLNSQVSSD